MHAGDRPVVQRDAAGERTLLASDLTGSVLRGQTKTGAFQSAYSPYGLRDKHVASLLAFNGQPIDQLTGHYPLGNGHRTYNPVLRRFNSADGLSPFGAGGLNTCAYCLGDPVNLHDPSGQNGILVWAKTKLLGGFSTATDFASGSRRVTQDSLSRGPVDDANFSASRRLLAEQVNTSTLFGQSVAGINKNLGSHGNTKLTMEKAQAYVASSHDSSNDPIKFFESSKDWAGQFMKERSPDAAVGAVMNLGGGFASGVINHAANRTGKTLWSTPDPASVRK